MTPSEKLRGLLGLCCIVGIAVAGIWGGVALWRHGWHITGGIVFALGAAWTIRWAQMTVWIKQGERRLRERRSELS